MYIYDISTSICCIADVTRKLLWESIKYFETWWSNFLQLWITYQWVDKVTTLWYAELKYELAKISVGEL